MTIATYTYYASIGWGADVGGSLFCLDLKPPPLSLTAARATVGVSSYNSSSAEEHYQSRLSIITLGHDRLL